MLYNSTRNKQHTVTASQAIVQGLSEEGGLFVPQNLKHIKFNYEEFLFKGYKHIAKVILKTFLDFSDEQIDYCIDNAYNTDNFETDDIFNVKDINYNLSILELFTGNTLAFKDCALSILPHLLKCAKENTNTDKKTLILTATSGDTGKAALEGFHDKDGIDVIVFYPHNGVSKLQLLQMLTQRGKNVMSVAVKGNFDDTQNEVKKIFNDKKFNEKVNRMGYELSSANSINIGRLLPQMVYYYYAYCKLVESEKIKTGEEIDFIVPTGNFGNILAGYYAKVTGLPIRKLVCASNDNNVLFDFFLTGTYNKNRTFKKTISPSMDILISSNLERLIYHMVDENDKKVNSLMKDLSKKGIYNIDKKIIDRLNTFIGGYAREEQIRDAIKYAYYEDRYLMDTHTAAGYKVYMDQDKETKKVLLSTASPYKFAKDVYKSIYGNDMGLSDDVEYMYILEEKSGVKIPAPLKNIEKLPRREENIVEKKGMEEKIIKYLEEK